MFKLTRVLQATCLVLLHCFVYAGAYAEQDAKPEPCLLKQCLLEQCLLYELASAGTDVTVGEIRSRCQADQVGKHPALGSFQNEKIHEVGKEASEERSIESRIERNDAGVIAKRISAEADIIDRPFVLTAHRPNYLLPYTYNNHPNVKAFQQVNPDRSIDAVETQFQVSFKFPLAQRFFSSQLGENNELFVGFTTRAWWQSYNRDLSSPFRETDYEPELFFRHYGGARIGGLKIAGWDVGIAHQSNGQSGSLSRSWNRVNGNLALEAGNLALALRSWYRLPEDGDQDDNPDLHQFLGYGDARLMYSYRNHMISAMFRPGTKTKSYEFTWSMPLWQQLRLYLVYFDGYGESLLDYNHRSRRIGIGVGLNDYLDTSVF